MTSIAARTEPRAIADLSSGMLLADAPRKLVHTWRAEWDAGNVTIVTYRLEPHDAGTRLTLRHEGFADRSASCAGHTEGWERVLGWLSDHFAH